MMYMIQGHPSEQGYPICQKIANRQELPAGLPEKRGGGSTAERALERDQAPGTDAVTHEPGLLPTALFFLAQRAQTRSRTNRGTTTVDTISKIVKKSKRKVKNKS